MWKLDNGTKLVNKGELWKSYDTWTLNPTSDNKAYYIENTSNQRILAIHDTDNTVISVKNRNATGNRWNKGLVNGTNCKDFFTLIHPHSVEVLTATTDNRLIVSKGNYGQGKFKIKLLYIPFNLFLYNSSIFYIHRSRNK